MQMLENRMGIIWYKSLYLGALVQKKAGRIKRKIDRGIYPPGVYLVTLSGGNAVLELIPASELKVACVRSQLPTVVGIAGGKAEAEYVASRIVQDTWEAQGDADVRRFLESEDRR